MKKQCKVISLCLCIALIISCLHGVGMVSNAATDEVLLNPGFESYDAETNEFDGWKFFTNSPETRTISNVKGLSGENAALITSTNNASVAAVEQQFIVDPDKSYRVSVWLKATGEGDTDAFSAAGWGTGIQLRIYSDDRSLDKACESIKTVMSWRKISFVVNADEIPEDAIKLTFSVYTQAVRGCIYIDDASVVEYNGEEDEPQYLYNAGFEDASATLIYDWAHGGRTDIFKAQISDATAYEGTNSLCFNSINNSFVNINQAIKGLDSSNRYLFSCYAKANTTAVAGGYAGLRIGVEYYDSTGTKNNVWSANGFQNAADWTKISLYFSIPEGATNIKAYVQSNGATGTYYVDALNIMTVGTVDSFANDSFEVYENGNFDYWTWYPGNGDAGENTIAQSDNGYEGKAVIISKSKRDNAANLKQTLDFTADAEKNYIVSAYVRATYSDIAPWNMTSWGFAGIRVTDGTTTLSSEKITDIGPWQKLSVIVNAGQLSASKNWAAEIYLYGMTGVVYLDNISIAEYTGNEENVTYDPLYNLGFEEGEGSAFDYWRTSGNVATVITETTEARNGNRAVSFYSENNGAVNKLYQSIYSFESDAHYVLSAYVKTSGTLETSYTGGGVKLEVTYTDAEGETQTIITATGLKTAEDWVQIRLPFSIPEGGTNPIAAIKTDCVKGTVLVDDLDIFELSLGDVNYDGNVNIIDLVRLKKFVAQATEDIYQPLSNLNSDSEINATDLSILRGGLLNGVLENDALEVWTVDSLTRVSKDSLSNGETTVSLFASKGEYEAFQLVTATNSQETTVLKNITVSDFVNESGDVIDSMENVTVYREHYVTCSVSSPASANVVQDSVGEIPDALIPAVSPVTGEALGSNARFYAFPYELSNSECQPFYIDVKIPTDAVSGDYTATYTVYTNKGLKKGKINLKVWDITLSQTQVQGSYFLSRSTASALKVEEAAKNRIFINAIDSEQEETLNIKYGYNNANLRFWSGADNKNPTMKAAPSETDVQTRINAHSSKLRLFNYTADEVGKYLTELKDGIIDYAKVLHKYNIKQLITMPPVAELLDDGTGSSAVDIWTMLPKQYTTNTEMIAAAREKGCEIWTYNCLVQDSYSPKFLLDYPLINYRIHPGFINYALDVDGFLYWSIDNYGSLTDPWTSLNDTTEGNVWNGDGILFYPGEAVGLADTFVPSLRAKAIRDGFEDYELCAAAGINIDDVSSIASSFSDWTQDKNVLLDGRKVLGNKYTE